MRPVFLLVALFYMTTVSGQTTAIKKLYAYAQPFVRGVDISPDTDDIVEGTKNPQQAFAYHLYAEQVKNTKIIFSSIWINGKAYEIRADRIDVPVKLSLDNKEETLVGKTTNPVWTLALGKIIEKPVASTSLKKLTRNNEFVLVYKWKGKYYYSVVKKIRLFPATHAA